MTDAPAPKREHLGTIGADRPCAACAFNLHGQPITRDPHYGLPIARCPECGTVAALQEYPALNRWAQRWAALVAALWLAVLVALFAATTLVCLLQTMAYVESMSEPVAQTLADEQARWVHALSDDELASLRLPRLPAGNVWDRVVPDWPGTANPRAVLDEHGGTIALIEWRYGWFWVASALFGFVAAALWAVALLHQPPRRAIIAPALALAVALALVTVAVRAPGGGRFAVQEFTRPLTAFPIAGATSAVLLASMIAGALAGRPLARLAVRLALPPRLRVPFGALWTADAKPPPRPR